MKLILKIIKQLFQIIKNNQKMKLKILIKIKINLFSLKILHSKLKDKI